VCSDDPLVPTVFRIAGVMPISNNFSLDLLGEMFNLHPEARMKMILDEDAALDLINGIHHLAEKGSAKKRPFISAAVKRMDVR